MNITQNEITFNSVKTAGVEKSAWPLILAGQQGPDSDGGVVNAVDIDWNGAQVEENVTINTTGELLSWIKNNTTDIEEGSITADKLNEDVWDEVTSLAKSIASNEIDHAGASKADKSDVNFLISYIGGLDNNFICRVGSDYTINDIYLFPNETIYIHITEATGFSGGLEIWVEGYYSERQTFDHSQLNSGDWVSVPVSELIGSHPEIQASITLHSVIAGDASDATDYEGILFVK